MSTFKVEVREMEKIQNHPKADRLDLAKVKGLDFQFVVQKGLYNEGDKVVYFPVDSVMPEDLIQKLGLEGFLAGKDKNRIKTVKLRGEIGQGFVCPVADLADYIGDFVNVGDDVTEDLRIKKYEPIPVMAKTGNLIGLPDGVPVYDIEGADRYVDVVKYLIDNKIKVFVTEKVEGTNFSVTVRQKMNSSRIGDCEVFVNSKNKSILEIEEPFPKVTLLQRLKNWIMRKPKPTPKKMKNSYWEAARDLEIISLAKQILSAYRAIQVTVRGELAGPKIQNNIYNFKKHEIFLFDIMIDGKYVDAVEFRDLTIGYDTAPTLAFDVTLEEWLDGRTVQKASDGKSKLAKVKREGIVIKPMVEMRHNDIGRLIIKQRSPEYLAKSEL